MIGIKKAQVTIFIIVGMIVLFATIFFIYFKIKLVLEKPILPEGNAHPVQRYVEDCLAREGEEAVRRIGFQGGFIEVPLNVQSSSSRYVSPDRLGIIKIPYWFYKGTKYNPSYSNIEREISKYVEENVKNCIKNFDAFKQQYDIIEQKKINVKTVLNRDDISIEADYSLKIIPKGNESKLVLDKFSAIVNVRLKKILDAANQLLDSELKGMFLENFTIDLMASNPDIPFTDMAFSCKVKEWPVEEIKKEVSEMLYYNIPRIRIRNTNYIPFLEPEANYKELLEYHMEDIAKGNYPKHVPSDAYEYTHMMWDVGLKKDNSISVGLRYIPEIGLDFIGRPHDNGILRSQLIQGSNKFVKILCINTWHFLYDVNYPVIVTIRDGLSFGGDGYLFSFAMPVTIRNNAPFKQFYGYDMFATSYLDRGFCDEKSDELTDIRVYGKEGGYSNIELKDVNISLQCFKYYCELGKTDADEGSYRLRTRLPVSCANPFIIAEKDGYLKAKKQATDSQKVELEMTKLKKLNYKVLLHRYNSIGGVIETEQELEPDMNVSIQLSSDDFGQYKLYPSDNSNEEISKIELIEGDVEYGLDIVLFQNEEYVGGYNGKWKPGSAEIADADTVVFQVIKYVPVPYTKEDKMKMMEYILNGAYKETLKPMLE